MGIINCAGCWSQPWPGFSQPWSNDKLSRCPTITIPPRQHPAPPKQPPARNGKQWVSQLDTWVVSILTLRLFNCFKLVFSQNCGSNDELTVNIALPLDSFDSVCRNNFSSDQKSGHFVPIISGRNAQIVGDCSVSAGYVICATASASEWWRKFPYALYITKFCSVHCKCSKFEV